MAIYDASNATKEGLDIKLIDLWRGEERRSWLLERLKELGAKALGTSTLAWLGLA